MVLIDLATMATHRLIDENPGPPGVNRYSRQAAQTVVDSLARGSVFTNADLHLKALQVTGGTLIDGIYACQLSEDQSLLFTANRGQNHLTVYDYPSLELRTPRVDAGAPGVRRSSGLVVGPTTGVPPLLPGQPGARARDTADVERSSLGTTKGHRMNAASETLGNAVDDAVDTAGESVRSIVDLTRKAVDTQIRLSQQYLDVLQKVWSRDADATAAGQAFLESTQREGSTYLSGLTELGVAYSSGVLQLGDAMTSSVLGDVSKAASSSRPRSSSSSRPGTGTTAKTATRKSTSRKTATKKTTGTTRPRRPPDLSLDPPSHWGPAVGRPGPQEPDGGTRAPTAAGRHRRAARTATRRPPGGPSRTCSRGHGRGGRRTSSTGRW